MGKALRVAVWGWLLCTASGFADPGQPSIDTHLRGEHHKRSRVQVVLPEALTAGTYAEAIDHFGALPGQTFSQRYWIDTEYATDPTTAPVIYHFCGEADCTQDYFLNDNAIEWAQALHANLAYLEHRYYGQSLPFADLSTDHLAYLTLDNVMEDLAGFQKWISAQNGWTGKWVSVGGSYSATLSAIYRLRHPELDAGALAASAPMTAGTGQPEGTDADVSDLSSTDPSSDTGDRQWAYEACTEFSFWQTDEFTIYTPSSWLCGQVFAGAPNNNPTTYNQDYDTPFITHSATAPTNILFTYGSADIWTTIGLPPQSNQNTGITITVIQGAGHHFDLNAPTSADSAAVIAARQQFQTLAAGWLGVSP